MSKSVTCSEETTFSSVQAVESASAQVQPRLREVQINNMQTNVKICDVWSVKKANPVENKPVVSNIPALVLAGEYDPVTPPSWGRLAAATLSKSYYYESPNTGHGVFWGGTSCARQIPADFLDDPTKSPGLDCYAGKYSFFSVP